MNNQEQFWQGQFGNDYTARNINLVENNYQMFKRIFDNSEIEIKRQLALYGASCLPIDRIYSKYDIKSVIEFGAGSGMNIQALQRIFPDAEFTAVEINEQAYLKLKNIGIYGTLHGSMFDFELKNYADLVLSKGLLIHIHPDNIQKAYDVLYNASNKYILLAEYYSSVRREILYRGEHNKLWAFNFIQPMLDKGCKIVDYIYISKYDQYPQDDLLAVLFSK